MAPGINLQNEASQQSLKTPSHYASSQSETSQEYKKQHQKDGSVEGVSVEETEVSTDDHTSSSDRSLNNSIVDIGERKIDELMNVIHKQMNAAANAFVSVGQIDNTISEEATKSSSIYDEIYEKRETKPRLIVGSRDINYKKDKGGNYHMGLMYDSGNNITFSKDDDPVIIIKNDNVKNEGDYLRFVAEIRECCNQKKGYYFEDYLKDHGFIEKEKEEDLDKLMKELEALRSKVMKELRL